MFDQYQEQQIKNVMVKGSNGKSRFLQALPGRWLPVLLAVFFTGSGCIKEMTGNNLLQTAPLIRGTLWWMNNNQIDTWSKDRFVQEIQAQQDVGFNLLWLLNTPQLTDIAIKAEAEGKPRDVLQWIFQIADEKGMHIIIDLNQNGGDLYRKMTAEEMVARTKPYIQTFYTRYGTHPSFYGWYLNNEINPLRSSDEVESRFWREAWKGIVRECHRVARGSLVTISPFFLLDKDGVRGFVYLLPDEYEEWWSITLKETGIDILMLQDSGEHMGFYTLEQREPFMAAFARACRKAGTRFWVNVESAQIDISGWDEYRQIENSKEKKPIMSSWESWRFTPIDWLGKKLGLAARYSENIVNWGYYPFMNPYPAAGEFPFALSGEQQPTQRKAYEAYKAYYQRTVEASGKLPPLK